MSLSSTALALVRSLDDLYRRAAMFPHEWDEEAMGEWLEETMADGVYLDRNGVKLLRRGVRRALRLQRYWSGRADGPDEWRLRVDEALGARGWEPGLALARWGLEHDPDPELFEEVQRRFRWVHFQPWADGLDYEEWLAGRD